MQKFEIVFRPLAEDDLFGLYRYVAEEAGREVAGAYIDRIEAACLALKSFPKRGTRRDDILPGLRTMGFERRVTIAFRVEETAVVIVRIFYGGQDFERALGAGLPNADDSNLKENP
jgi:toxin ParE1/3/4